jgi:hypothetical protein
MISRQEEARRERSPTVTPEGGRRQDSRRAGRRAGWRRDGHTGRRAAVTQSCREEGGDEVGDDGVARQVDPPRMHRHHQPVVPLGPRRPGPEAPLPVKRKICGRREEHF